MLPVKIRLTEDIMYKIKSARTEKRIPAAELSKAINRDDSYISSLELKRLKTISSNDLIAMLCYIYDIPEHIAAEKAEMLINNAKDAIIQPIRENDGYNINTGGQNLSIRELPINEYSQVYEADFADPELISDMLNELKEQIIEFYKKDPKEAVFALTSFVKALKIDPAFTMHLMGTPYVAIKELSNDMRTKALAEIISVLKK